MQRRKTVLSQVIDVAADLAQRIHQVANRALVHTRHTAQFKVAAQNSQRGGERTNRGAGVAHEQRRLPVSELATQTVNLNGSARLPHTTPQRAQGLKHDAGVVGVEQIVQRGAARAQGRQQQHAVGDALGAG